MKLFFSSTVHGMNQVTICLVLVPFITVTSAADPCTNYKTINEAWRNVNKHHSEVGVHCDRNNFTTGVWYRFSGPAGNRMADSCVAGGKGQQCGTGGSMWLSGGHPRVEDGVVTRKVCAEGRGSCCHSSYSSYTPSIEVKKCPQGYFVYKMKPPTNCDFAYCAVQDNSDPCLSSSCSDIQTCFIESGKAVCRECKAEQVFGLNSKTCVDVNNTTILCGKNEMKIAIKKSFLPGIQAKHLQLQNASCTASEDREFFIFRLSFKSCGTTKAFTDSSVVYENRVLIQPDSYVKDGVIRSDQPGPDINVKCEYPREQVMESRFQPAQNNKSTDVNGQGDFKFSMEQFRTDKFQQAYTSNDYPLKMRLGDLIYFQTSVITNIDNATALVEECKATSTVVKSHYLIKDGCVVDNTTTVYDSSPNPTTVNMSFQAFALSPLRNEVYLHCKLLVCDGNDAGSRCQKGCVKQSGKKRDSENYSGVHHHAYVSMGPVIVESQ